MANEFPCWFWNTPLRYVTLTPNEITKFNQDTFCIFLEPDSWIVVHNSCLIMLLRHIEAYAQEFFLSENCCLATCNVQTIPCAVKLTHHTPPFRQYGQLTNRVGGMLLEFPGPSRSRGLDWLFQRGYRLIARHG